MIRGDRVMLRLARSGDLDDLHGKLADLESRDAHSPLGSMSETDLEIWSLIRGEWQPLP